MSSANVSNVSNETFPVLCIPRAMLFHTAEIVEKAINQALHGKFVKSVQQTTTTDKSGVQFNVFFIHPDQDFKANLSTDTLYKTLKTEGTVNISTGTGKFFWKVKLYMPHLKAQYFPPAPVVSPAAVLVVRPVPVGPRIMSVEEEAEFEEWRREKAKLQAEKQAAELVRQCLGNRLHPLVVECLNQEYPLFKHAAKVTGMILEWSPEDIEDLFKNPEELTRAVHEGVKVYREHLLREAGAA